MAPRIPLFLTLVTLILLSAGCPKPQENVGMQTSGSKTSEDAETSSYWEPDCVITEGLPLVFTRQMLPVDAEGSLVGADSVDAQIARAMENLHAALEAAGGKEVGILRLNVYADSEETIQRVREEVSRTGGHMITAVVTPLPISGAKVAFDAVAAKSLSEEETSTTLLRLEDLSGRAERADVAYAPQGGLVFFSGQPDKKPRLEATANSMNALMDMAEQLEVERSRILHLKVFIDDPAASEEVLAEMKESFPDRKLPPVSFVKWTASAPIEIEMVAHLPLPEGDPPAERLEFYNPPDVDPSPTFTRAVKVKTDHLIFLPGMTSREPGSGTAQTRDIFEQMESSLEDEHSDLEHLAKATYYVSDEESSSALNKLRPDYYNPKRPPAASKVMVDGVGRAERSLSIDMIAIPAEPPAKPSESE